MHKMWKLKNLYGIYPESSNNQLYFERWMRMSDSFFPVKYEIQSRTVQ